MTLFKMVAMQVQYAGAGGTVRCDYYSLLLPLIIGSLRSVFSKITGSRQKPGYILISMEKQ